MFTPLRHQVREHVIKSTCDENVNQLTLGVGEGGGGLRPCNITIAQNQSKDIFTFFTRFQQMLRQTFFYSSYPGHCIETINSIPT